MKILKRFLTILWVLPLFLLISFWWVIIIIPSWIVTGKDNITAVVTSVFENLEARIEGL